MTTLRLATANILNGVDLAVRAVDNGRMAEALAALDGDVLALQEVDRFQPRSGGVDQTQLVVEAMQARCGRPVSARFVPALVGVLDGSDRWSAAQLSDRHVDRPQFGDALVVGLPVRSWHAIPLAPIPVRSPVLVPGWWKPLLLRDQPRVVIAAVAELPGGGVATFATVHLSFTPGWNAWQLRKAVGALRRLPGPRVLLGDYNLPGRLPEWITGWRGLGPPSPTFPSPAPRLRIDHILTDGRELAASVRSSSVSRLAVSDHCAVVVDLAPVRSEHRLDPALRGDARQNGSGAGRGEQR